MTSKLPRDLFIRNGEQVHVERHAVAGPERMLPIRENFRTAKNSREQTAQARPREKILMIALE
jgi:hypothetical protein